MTFLIRNYWYSPRTRGLKENPEGPAQGALPMTDKKNFYYKDAPSPVIEELWARFFEALRPLQLAGKLGAVLFQFPHWVTAAPKARTDVSVSDRFRISPRELVRRKAPGVDSRDGA